jgi:FkbM family methyltransferase
MTSWRSRLSQVVTISGHTFVPLGLGPGATVVDLGANRGNFSNAVRQRFGSRCIAVEASPGLAEQLRSIPGIEVQHAAIAGRRGELTFYDSDDIYVSNLYRPVLGAKTRNVRVPALKLVDLLDRCAVPQVDLLKVDIEGAEVELIDSASPDVLARLDQISIEFHDFCELVSQDDLIRVRHKLRDAGFDEVRFGPGHYNSLYVRRGRPPFGTMRRAYLRLVTGPLVRWIYMPLRSLWHAVRPARLAQAT